MHTASPAISSRFHSFSRDSLALVVFCACLLAAPALRSDAQASRPPYVLLTANDHEGGYTRQASFGPSGSLTIVANVGDVLVRRGVAGTLKLVINPERSNDNADAASWVREWSVTPQAARIELKMPSHGNRSGHVTLYVPESTSVKLALEVGNAEMDALDGNVEADIGVGNLTVCALEAAQYHQVRADVTMGNITDGVFGMGVSGMLGKDASYRGSGPLKIRLHARIGNIEIDKEKAAGS